MRVTRLDPAFLSTDQHGILVVFRYGIAATMPTDARR
jgi:hypothetical protein